MNNKNDKGYTLLEMMIAVAIFTMVMGTLYTLSFTMGRTQRIMDAKFQSAQESRNAIVRLMPELTQASRNSIVIADGATEGDSFSYRVPVDSDGNGFAVDVSGAMEVSGVRTISVNSNNQLILTDAAGTVTVLANNINPGREFATGVNGEFIADNDDTNGNGRQDMGFNIARNGNGFTITVGTLVETVDRNVGADGSTTPFDAFTQINQVVVPRNR